MFSRVGETWIEIQARILTTHRVEKYGGIKFEKQALDRAAEQINAGGGGMDLMVDHDATRPVRQRNQRASVIRLDDGEFALELTAEVAAADWAAADGMRGMSVTHFDPLGSVDGPFPARMHIELAAEASVWTRHEIAHACEQMSIAAPVDGFELMQFARDSDRRVIVRLAQDFAVQATASLLVIALSNGVGALVTSGQDAHAPTRIELVTETTDGRWTAVIDTADPEVARAAIARLPGAVPHADSTGVPSISVWNSATDQWEALSTASGIGGQRTD